MVIVQTYSCAVALCFVTMLCWGSWANTQKLPPKTWRFELFYWDYVLGIVLTSLLFGLTLGSTGTAGRAFAQDLGQASSGSLVSAFIGGIIFNAGNIMLIAAIDIAGMAVAFPVGIGLALVLGVVVNYMGAPAGSPLLLFGGVAAVAAAIILDALAYGRIPNQAKSAGSKGLLLSVGCGILMGFFYRFVAGSMSSNFVQLEPGKMGPYAAVFIFSLGVLASNVAFNTFIMKKPFRGEPVSYSDYFAGTLTTHGFGLLGGFIWGVGTTLNILASGSASFAIAYGLGQGATMVAALWGVFIWKEFRGARPGTNVLIGLMFLFYLLGLGLIIVARQA